jgi:hypothetical protein
LLVSANNARELDKAKVANIPSGDAIPVVVDVVYPGDRDAVVAIVPGVAAPYSSLEDEPIFPPSAASSPLSLIDTIDGMGEEKYASGGCGCSW